MIYNFGEEGFQKSLLIKYTANGIEEWVNYYEPVYDNFIEPKGITIDNSDSIYITGGDGYLLGSLYSFVTAFTLKYDSYGLIQWERFYDCKIGLAIKSDINNDIYIAGYKRGDIGLVLGVIKYDSNGSILWDSQTVLNSDDYDLKEINFETDNQDNVILTTRSSNDNRIVKLDDSGNEVWLWDVEIYPKDIFIDTDGNFYITGSNNDDYEIVKYNQSGNQEWLIQHNGSENLYDCSTSVKVDNLGNLYISGFCRIGFFVDSCVTIKYSQTNLSNDSFILTDKSNISISPNPFNPATTISFSIQESSLINLSIYNSKGQNIKKIVQNKQLIGFNSIIWNGDDDLGKEVSSGVYLLKLDVNGKTETVKKCILLK